MGPPLMGPSFFVFLAILLEIGGAYELLTVRISGRPEGHASLDRA